MSRAQSVGVESGQRRGQQPRRVSLAAACRRVGPATRLEPRSTAPDATSSPRSRADRSYSSRATATAGSRHSPAGPVGAAVPLGIDAPADGRLDPGRPLRPCAGSRAPGRSWPSHAPPGTARRPDRPRVGGLAPPQPRECAAHPHLTCDRARGMDYLQPIRPADVQPGDLKGRRGHPSCYRTTAAAQELRRPLAAYDGAPPIALFVPSSP